MQHTGNPTDRSGRVMTVGSLTDFFRETITGAIERQGADVGPQAAHYVVNLMTLFSRSEQLYEQQGEVYGLRPLALMMADAADAASAEERKQRLQRIGDVALFVSGFFADSLRTTAVDIDYYVSMGGSAYGCLSDEVRGTARGKAFAGVFRELAEKFTILVDVLHEVRGDSAADADLLRTYEIWLRTGSPRAARRLSENNVVPLRPAGALLQH